MARNSDLRGSHAILDDACDEIGAVLTHPRWPRSRERAPKRVLGAAGLAVTIALVLTACANPLPKAKPDVVRPVDLPEDSCSRLPAQIVSELGLVPWEDAGFCVRRGAIDGRAIGLRVTLYTFPIRPRPVDEYNIEPHEDAEDWVGLQCSGMERWDSWFDSTETGCISSLATCDETYTGRHDLYTKAVEVLHPDLGAAIEVVLTYPSPQQTPICGEARKYAAAIAEHFATAPPETLTAD